MSPLSLRRAGLLLLVVVSSIQPETVWSADGVDLRDTRGPRGGRVVDLRRGSGVTGELVAGAGTGWSVFLEADRERIGVERVWLELRGDEETYTVDLVRDSTSEDAVAFVPPGDLPERFRNADGLRGTLHVRIDGERFSGPLGKPGLDAARFTADPPRSAAVTSWTVTLLVVYCVLIVGASLLGGWIPTRLELTHNLVQMVISFVGGFMLGISLFHMLPHAVHELGSLDEGIWWTMTGLLLMFLLIRTFHFHQHEPVELSLPGGEAAVPMAGHDHDHDGGQQHAHGHGGHDHAHRLSWVGVALGLGLHTLIDGVALAASVQSESARNTTLSLFGLGTFLAVLLHKPLDAVSITSLMRVGGWSAAHRNLVNLSFAAMCPLGALVFVFGLTRFETATHVIVGSALALAAGVFLCISLGDLLPEMEFHSHNRVQLTLLLFLGVALAWALGFLEPGHVHGTTLHAP